MKRIVESDIGAVMAVLVIWERGVPKNISPDKNEHTECFQNGKLIEESGQVSLEG